jgi:hypothetical protein
MADSLRKTAAEWEVERLKIQQHEGENHFAEG